MMNALFWFIAIWFAINVVFVACFLIGMWRTTFSRRAKFERRLRQ